MDPEFEYPDEAYDQEDVFDNSLDEYAPILDGFADSSVYDTSSGQESADDSLIGGEDLDQEEDEGTDISLENVFADPDSSEDQNNSTKLINELRQELTVNDKAFINFNTVPDLVSWDGTLHFTLTFDDATGIEERTELSITDLQSAALNFSESSYHKELLDSYTDCAGKTLQERFPEWTSSRIHFYVINLGDVIPQDKIHVRVD